VKVLAMGFVVLWLMAGVGIYAMIRLDVLPLGTLGWYTLIWLGIALISVAILVLAVRNPFNKMTAEERERVVGIVRQLSVNEPVAPADTTWMVALFKKYGGGRKETDMFRLLKRAIVRRLRARMTGRPSCWRGGGAGRGSTPAATEPAGSAGCPPWVT